MCFPFRFAALMHDYYDLSVNQHRIPYNHKNTGESFIYSPLDHYDATRGVDDVSTYSTNGSRSSSRIIQEVSADYSGELALSTGHSPS